MVWISRYGLNPFFLREGGIVPRPWCGISGLPLPGLPGLPGLFYVPFFCMSDF